MNEVLHMARRWWRGIKATSEATVYRKENVGARSHLDSSVQVLGWRNVRIGHHTILSADVWLNVNDRKSPDPAILIGNHCFIGRRNFFSSGKLITVGDYCLTGVDCHFLGADHMHMTPFAPYATTGTTLHEKIHIGANCWLGSSVTVLMGVTVGHGSIIGAASVVTRDIPPFSIAVGSPARVIKRFDVRKSAWVPAAEYSEDDAAQVPAEADYVAQLHDSHPSARGPVIASSHVFGDL